MSASNPGRIAYVGSRTTAKRQAQGKGITVYRITDGRWDLLQVLESVNPSFLTLDAAGRHLYGVHGDGDQVSSYAVNVDGTLTHLNSQPTRGTNPAHLTIDPSGRYLLVANHTSGSVASLPIGPDGSLDPVVDLLEFVGEPGPFRGDQEGSKPHQVVFDPTGRYFLVPDKGLDRVFVGRIDPATGHLHCVDDGGTRWRQASGPRHLTFHPTLDLVYVIDELSSTVTTGRWDPQTASITVLQRLSTTAPQDTADSRGGEIAVDPAGRFVYASNRSGAGDHTAGGPDQDTIAVYPVQDTGELGPAAWFPTGGIRPRFFAVTDDGDRLVAANERSHTIVTFDVDPQTGALTTSGDPVDTGSPVCIVFADR